LTDTLGSCHQYKFKANSNLIDSYRPHPGGKTDTPSASKVLSPGYFLFFQDIAATNIIFLIFQSAVDENVLHSQNLVCYRSS